MLPFRQPSRIDYSDPKVIARRRAEKLRQREVAAQGRFALGRFFIIDGRITFAGIRRNVTWDLDTTGKLTTKPDAIATWNTKQAARQWLLRNPRPGCHMVNIDRLGTHDTWDAADDVRHD